MKELLVPVAIALISSPVLTLIITWVRQRDFSFKRNQALEQAGKRVAFLEAWFKAQQLVRMPEEVEAARQLAQKELDLTLRKLSNTSRGLVKPIIPYKSRPFLQRILLLFPPANFTSLFVRVIFYVLLPFLGLMTLGLAAKENNEFSLSQLSSNWKTLSAFFLIFLPIIMLMHHVAVRGQLQKERVGIDLDQLWTWENADPQPEPTTRPEDASNALPSSSRVGRTGRTGSLLLLFALGCWVGSIFIFRSLNKEEKIASEAESHREKAETLASNNDTDAATSEFALAIKLHPTALAYAERGNVYLEKKQYDSAISDYTEALNLSPTDSVVYTNRGYALSMKGSNELALTDYSKAIGLEPKNSTAYFNRARLLEGALKRWDEARVSFEAALRLDENNSDISYEFGDALVRHNQELPLAIELIQRGVKDHPDNAYYHASLGQAFFKSDRFHEAEESLAKAVELGDSRISTKLLLAYVREKLTPALTLNFP